MSERGNARPGWQAGGRASNHRKRSGNRSLAFYNDRGQRCGRWEGGWLVKQADPDRHLLRSEQAWCVDATHLAQLRSLGGYGVRICTPDGTTYEARLAVFDAYGFGVDFGHGRQVGLPLAQWTKRRLSQQSLWEDWQ